MKIQGSVALVTGANRSLGLAFARALVEAGAHKVYGTARNAATITTPGVVPIELDITKPQDVDRAARQCADVSLLINNAGVFQPQALLGTGGIETTRAQLETNLFGTLAMSQAFAPVLAAQGGGALVNVLSALSWLSLPQAGGYGVSKSAAWALTNALRNELRRQGTLVVALHAAFIDTDMARHIEAPKASPADVVRQALLAIEAGREEVLADDTTRTVKGGLNAEPPLYLKAPAP